MIKLQIAILNSNGDKNSAKTNAVNLDIISMSQKFVRFFNNSNKKLTQGDASHINLKNIGKNFNEKLNIIYMIILNTYHIIL